MEPVRIEFLMVDKLSARLDKAVNKMEQMTGKATQANRQMRELDRTGQSLQRTIGRLGFRLRHERARVEDIHRARRVPAVGSGLQDHAQAVRNRPMP